MSILVHITIHREPWPMIVAQLRQWEGRPGISAIVVSVNHHAFTPTAPRTSRRTLADVDREREELIARYQIHEEPLADVERVEWIICEALANTAIVDVVPADRAEQGDLLNHWAARASYVGRGGADWISVWDCDEFITDAQWALVLAEADRSDDLPVLAPNREYVVDLEHRIVPDDDHQPAILARPWFAKFRRRRLLGPPMVRLHPEIYRTHAGWVGSDNALRYKLVHHAHFAEITPEWKAWVLDRPTRYPPAGCWVYPRKTPRRVVVDAAPAAKEST